MRLPKVKRATLGVASIGLICGIAASGVAQTVLSPWVDLSLLEANDAEDGSVVIGTDFASGSLAVAKANYATTGEFIGCRVRFVPDDGNIIRCGAKDAGGNLFVCESSVSTVNLTSGEGPGWQALMSALAGMGEKSHLRFRAPVNGGACQTIFIHNSSADFLGESIPGCVSDPITLESATASSQEASAYSASKAIDGNGGTRWSSAFADNQWIKVDLGFVHAIEEVQIDWEGAYSTDYQVQVSDDGSSWMTVFTELNGNGGNDVITGLNATGRYVRVYGGHRNTQYGHSIYELRVYGDPDPTCE